MIWYVYRFHQHCSLLYVVDLSDLDLGKIIPCCMHLACLLLWYDIYPDFIKIIRCCICIWPVTVCVTIVSGRPGPHQLSIIGILILHKSKPANKNKQHLCLAVEYPNDNKRFYRAEKIWEKIWKTIGAEKIGEKIGAEKNGEKKWK